MNDKLKLPTYETILTEAIRSLAVDSGIVSSTVQSGGNALSDSTKNWAPHIHINRLVKIISGQGAGQQAVIQDNSATTLVIRGVWPQAIGAGAVYVILGEDLASLFGTGRGNIYVNSDTAVNDNPRRFETARRMLAWALISVATNGQVFGSVAGQTFPIAAAGTAGLGRVDLSTLYFMNQTPGLNGTVYILGVED